MKVPKPVRKAIARMAIMVVRSGRRGPGRVPAARAAAANRRMWRLNMQRLDLDSMLES